MVSFFLDRVWCLVGGVAASSWGVAGWAPITDTPSLNQRLPPIPFVAPQNLSLALFQGYQSAIAGARAVSEKALAGAAAAAARAEEGEVLLQKAEARMGVRLDESVQNQVGLRQNQGGAMLPPQIRNPRFDLFSILDARFA